MPLSINGELIHDSDIRKEASLLRPQFEQAMADLDPLEQQTRLWEWSRENVIEKTLLRQEALKAAEPVTDEDILQAIQRMKAFQPGAAACDPSAGSDSFKRDVEVQLRVDRLLAKVASEAAAPDKKAVTEFYRKHREEFRTEETIHAAHVVKHINEDQDEAAAMAGIQEALAQLQQGADFAAVADALSDCPGRGGDLGWFARGVMVDEFDAVAFALRPGEHSGIFRTVFGFHVARLLERKPAGVRPLPEVRDEIEAHLLEEARRARVEQYVDDLKAAADIRKLPQEGRSATE
ncbi:MAG: peptidylprolyl isomerase [Bryobacterales bacterium]|jgi:parvulin-like peptidyl-prolyl isomerase|nr:peptidylprolyl isomerase [Bryobacterales bacterium]